MVCFFACLLHLHFSSSLPPPTPPAHTLLFLSPQRSKQGRRRNTSKRTKAVMSGIQMLAFYYGLHMFFKDTLASSLPFAYPLCLLQHVLTEAMRTLPLVILLSALAHCVTRYTFRLFLLLNSGSSRIISRELFFM